MLRRAVWPHRERLNSPSRQPHTLVPWETPVYLPDCYDHVVQLMNLLETYREISSALMDVYISSVNTKLGETMKVLMIIATVFLPLGFIASLYGMNFDRDVSAWNLRGCAGGSVLAARLSMCARPDGSLHPGFDRLFLAHGLARKEPKARL